jgi:hypothetical protein
MRKELTYEELEAQQVDLLPNRETLSTNLADVWASNASLALNAASIDSMARSEALQSIVVHQD